MKYSLVHILQRDRAATRIYSQGECCKANPNLLSNNLARQCTFIPKEAATVYTINRGISWIFFSMVCIQHCFICRPSDSAVSEDAGIEPRTVATSALAVRRSKHSSRSLPQLGYRSHPQSARSHPIQSHTTAFCGASKEFKAYCTTAHTICCQ